MPIGVSLSIGNKCIYCPLNQLVKYCRFKVCAPSWAQLNWQEIDRSRDFLHQNRVISALLALKQTSISRQWSGNNLLLFQAIDFARLVLCMAQLMLDVSVALSKPKFS